METALITASAAIFGSFVGGLTLIASTYLTQRHQGLRERILRDLDRKEDVYTRFNQTAAELLLDSLDHSLDEPAKLVVLWTIVGQIRLTSSAVVLGAAEHVIDELLASYAKPPVDPRRALATIPEQLVEPLVAFTEACRTERETLLRQLL